MAETFEHDRGQAPRWLRDAQTLLAQLDPRELTILAERVFGLADDSPTLQELGDRFALTRERVRQIESAAKDAVASGVASTPSIATTVDRIRRLLGAMFTSAELSEIAGVEIDPASLLLEVQLALFLGGPYRREGDTFLRVGFEQEVRRLLASLSAGSVPLAEVRGWLGAIGLRDDFQLRVLEGVATVRVLGGHVVSWSGSLGDKAAAILAQEGRVMTADEIHTSIGEGAITTLKNYLGSDGRFLRRGLRTWGLSEWGGDLYEGVAVEMADALRGLSHGVPVDRLKRELAEKFGIAPASVEMMSATHPRFVRDGAWVRLRLADEPYVPDTALEETRDCVVVDGAWAWRHLVTRETLRGSGHTIPESFAAHLAVFPASRRTVASDVGAILLSWPAQKPGIGSLRRAVEQTGAEAGDYLFVIPIGDRIEFTRVGTPALSQCDPVRQLLSRLGQAADSDPWRRARAQAVGLPPHSRDEEIDELLDVRGDREVLRLFRSARLAGEDR